MKGIGYAITSSITRLSHNLLPLPVVIRRYKRIETMKRFLFIGSLLGISLGTAAFAQSSRSPTMQQSTSTTNSRQANPVKPKMKKTSRREQMKMEAGVDSTLPKNRKQKRLRPDSLRRGGATRVDSVRR